MLQCVRLLATDKSKHISREAAARHDFTRVHFDPMESDRRSSFLFGRIFCDDPASTSPENALVFWIERLIPGRRSSNDRESRTQTMRMLEHVQPKCTRFGVKNMLKTKENRARSRFHEM